ncbi:protein kinase [Lentisphaerota bacterium ZTH]|nr:protein kinase [Lentisphaerota bacterium]WET07007.1 protein kinase [Lentisphaerota bacterium ZTH]
MAKILIADDCPVVRKCNSTILELLGHEIISCKDGQEALKGFMNEAPDLLLLDVNMPGMSGLEVCREIRRHPQGLSVPIIMVSALEEESDIISGLNAGADDYLIKPVREGHLVAKLKAFLGIVALKQADRDLVKNRTVLAGRYRIERLLGYGAHSAVFLVHDMEKADKQFALKLMRDSFVSEEIAKPLLKSARKLMEVDSKYVVKIYDIGKFNSRIYLVMEYVAGGSLDKMIKHRTFSENEAALMARDISRGIAELEKLGMIHLDIKPGNILVSENFKLADFGVMTASNSATMPLNGQLWTTAAYISPEYLTREGEISSKSDIYSLGITIYEAMTGDNPFQAQRPSIGMYRQVHLKIPPLQNFNSTISSYMVQVVEAMLGKNPAERPGPEESAEIFTVLLEFLQKKSNKFHAERSYYSQKFSGNSYRTGTSYDLEEVKLRLENLNFFKNRQVEQQSTAEKKDMRPVALSGMRRFLIAAVIIIAVSVMFVSGYMVYRDRYSGLKNFVPDYGKEYLDDAEIFILSSHAGRRKCAMCKLIYSPALAPDNAKLSTLVYEKLRERSYRCPRCLSPQTSLCD